MNKNKFIFCHQEPNRLNSSGGRRYMYFGTGKEIAQQEAKANKHMIEVRKKILEENPNAVVTGDEIIIEKE